MAKGGNLRALYARQAALETKTEQQGNSPGSDAQEKSVDAAIRAAGGKPDAPDPKSEKSEMRMAALKRGLAGGSRGR